MYVPRGHSGNGVLGNASEVFSDSSACALASLGTPQPSAGPCDMVTGPALHRLKVPGLPIPVSSRAA